MKQGKETARLVVEWVGRAKSSPLLPLIFASEWLASAFAVVVGGEKRNSFLEVSRPLQAQDSCRPFVTHQREGRHLACL